MHVHILDHVPVAPRVPRGHQLEHEGGTSVREGFADDVGVASVPANVHDGVIAVPT